ncbi:MAG: NAD(P)/FAD-dependent oxidoreductase [Pseudomonadota bacterium]
MTATESIDCAVIGAGVVGLAAARALAMAGREVIVLEAEGLIGSITSARNSEVIHAGIYYPIGSLKAQVCVDGRKWLYGYCEERGINHKKCGKLIVATSDAEIPALEKIHKNALAAGVDDIVAIRANEAIAMEPELHCVAALHSPSTGIIDSHGLMLAYQGDAEDLGAMIAFKSPVERGEVADDGIMLDVGGEYPMRLKCGIVVNSAGLFAPALAGKLAGFPGDKIPTPHLAKGNYYALQGKAPFSRLVYPVPRDAGLGVHITVDLGGQARFGPDVEWVEEIDYDVDPSRCEGFYEAISTYWPDIPEDSLVPDYSGIRPKIHGPGEPQPDFMVQGPADHGVPGLVNLFGIESPGLTSSKPIADHVVRKLGL